MSAPSIDDVRFSAMTEQIGSSPWKARGFVYQSAFSFAKQHVDGGVAAVKRALPDVVREYVSQRMRALEWYDMWGLALFHRAIAELRGISFEQQAQECGVFACTHDLSSGPHAMLIKMLKPKQMAQYVPRMGQFFLACFEKVESHRVSDTRFVTNATRAPVAPGMFVLHLAMSYNAETVRLVGGQDVSYEVEALERVGDDRMNVRYAISWRR